MSTNNSSDSAVSFSLGAGASMDLGFPSGHELKQRIAQSLTGKPEPQLQLVAQKLFGDDEVEEFVKLLTDKKKASLSIDAILHDLGRNNGCLLEIGRVAVWYTILEFEQKTNFSDIENFWLWRFLERQFGKYRSFENFYRNGPENQTCFMNNLTIQTLNYDRLAEEVIRLWAARRLSDGEEKEKFNQRALSDLVTHKHGSFGPIQGVNAFAFGAPFPTNNEDRKKRAKTLRFWFEVSNEPHNWRMTNRIIELRDILIILGYGYHELIGRRFRVENFNNCDPQTIIASCY